VSPKRSRSSSLARRGCFAAARIGGRELVPDARDNLYEFNREDSLMLATIAAFRVVAERDLEDFHDADRTLDHLRDEGLIHTVQIGAGEHARHSRSAA
jgi:hypothetical protein